eukprot:TRINITY_DN271_c0_g3_i1.p2 TRINITY_DN271_c0_g3~~TRINITY_DN271_c0_g3_i1.p2  ORF type:complete len:470 (+),score=158.67 TRINITY_DN271_c0_g3_i1:72-1481(+)
MAPFLQLQGRDMEGSFEVEEGLSSEEVGTAVGLPTKKPLFTPKRVIAVCAGALGLAGCAGAAFLRGSPAQQVQPDHITARALLEHPEFVDIASSNVWELGKEHMQGKEEKLRPAVQHMMAQLSEIIQEYDPESSKHLESIKLSPEQRRDVLSVVKRMGDSRVQAVGKEVLEVAAKHHQDGMDAIGHELHARFQPRMGELRALKESVLPVSLRAQEAEAAEATTATDMTGRRLNCVGDASKCSPGSMLTSSMSSGMAMKLEDALALIGGLAEQARLALDEASVIGTSFGSVQHHVPWEARSMIGALAFGTETLDCFMRQDDEHETKKDGTTVLKNGESGQMNTVKAAMCPMKYAGAGMDALSGLNNMMGIQNSRLPYDFQMMFGGGAPQQMQAGYNPHAAYNPAYNQGYARAAPAMSPFNMFAPHPQQQQPAMNPMHQMASQMMGHGMQMMGQHANQMMGQHAAGFAYPR